MDQLTRSLLLPASEHFEISRMTLTPDRTRSKNSREVTCRPPCLRNLIDTFVEIANDIQHLHLRWAVRCGYEGLRPGECYSSRFQKFLSLLRPSLEFAGPVFHSLLRSSLRSHFPRFPFPRLQTSPFRFLTSLHGLPVSSAVAVSPLTSSFFL